MNLGNFWSDEDVSRLIKLYKERPPDVSVREFGKKIAPQFGRNQESVNGKINSLRLAGKLEKQYIQPSPYPIYDSPLVMEGDALVLPDLEFPFHHSEFVNRVLELAEKWKIRQCILAGDVLHFDSLSGWEPNWTAPSSGGLSADAESLLMQFAQKLPSKSQGELMGLLGDIGEKSEKDGVSTELAVARKELHRIAGLFDSVHIILGNHEGRLLRSLQTAINPDEILRLLVLDEKWKIATFYYSYLETKAGRFQIEHPKNSGKFSASKLASKYGCHILMGHSHQLNYTFDVSGRFYAIEMGCCVDEERLPYAAQRHNVSPTHALGAVIVRGGIPYLLHTRVDWERMGKM
jgi:hypothetical protein